jgi:malate dehydrogenase
MSKTPIRVAVTGAAGQIGYSLLFRIASGAMFGPDQPVILHLIEMPDEKAMAALGGVVHGTGRLRVPAAQRHRADLESRRRFSRRELGAARRRVPRKAGMERKDLLGINGKIFTGQGNAIQKNAASDVRVLVVGNPCNTNSLIAMNNAPGVPKRPFLRHDRARRKPRQVAARQKRPAWMSPPSATSPSGATTAPRCIPISTTPKSGQPVPSSSRTSEWLKGEFITTVQQRGAAIIKARGLSSAASAANAAVNTVYKLTHPTPAGDWFSVAVHSDGSYGIEKGLIFSYPHPQQRQGF